MHAYKLLLIYFSDKDDPLQIFKLNIGWIRHKIFDILIFEVSEKRKIISHIIQKYG